MPPEVAQAFFGLLVVTNVAPILPVALQVTQDVSNARRRVWLLRSLLAGNVLAFIVLAGGSGALQALGIRVDDVRVAGGLILLVFATYDLLFSRELRKSTLVEVADHGHAMDLVPLAIPILVGPATIAAILVSRIQFGVVPTLLAITANALINAAMLLAASALVEKLGHGALRAAGKVFGVVLASYAVAMIRTGLSNWGATL